MADILTLAIPNFNGAHYLPHTLASLARNRPHVRWYLQDSCSTDASVALAEAAASSQDRICVEKDQGQADGLNRAFQAMGGEIVGFLNSDDCLSDGAAEAVLTAFRDNPSADIVVGEVEWINSEGAMTGHHRGEIATLDQMLNIYDFWWRKRQWVQPEVFYRRSVWERAGCFDTRYNLAFDFDYWVRALRSGARVKKIDRVLCQFRIHDEQKSKQAVKAAQEIRRIVWEALASNPPIPFLSKERLQASLAYDEYQLMPGPKPSLAASLIQHPQWLLAKDLRRRIRRRSPGHDPR